MKKREKKNTQTSKTKKILPLHQMSFTKNVKGTLLSHKEKTILQIRKKKPEKGTFIKISGSATSKSSMSLKDKNRKKKKTFTSTIISSGINKIRPKMWL